MKTSGECAIVIVAGPICAGKSLAVSAFLKKYERPDVRRFSVSSECILPEMERRGIDSSARGAIDAFSCARRQENGNDYWLLYSRLEIDAFSQANHNGLLIWDSSRNVAECETAREIYGDRVLVVVFTADDEVLVNRVRGRDRSIDNGLSLKQAQEVVSYQTHDSRPYGFTHQQILVHPGVQVIDTSTGTVEETQRRFLELVESHWQPR